jgi:hypothetical protein
MNAPDTSLDVKAADDIWMSHRSAGTNKTQREDAVASAGGGNAATLGAADWLCLAAAPTFAIMALLTAVLGGGAPDMLCSAAQAASQLGGMVPMYLLMSAFHSAPWLKLISGRRSGARRSGSGVRRIERRRTLLARERRCLGPVCGDQHW